MNIEKRLLTINPFSRPGKKFSPVKGVVVHWVGNPGTSALQNRNYFEGLKSQSMSNHKATFASAHFIVGLPGEVIQCLPLDEMAYHVGAKTYTPEAISRFGQYPNNCTIGIELCYPARDGKFTPETWISAVELTAYLVKLFRLEMPAGIWTHHGITRKECPKYFVEHPEAFERFKLDTDIAMGEIPEGEEKWTY
ncbi:MAG: N-acetylmuramoyl-L-alanine amidase [Treponema sp.]|jgi:N-acetylmuramoyl-L-alanine amidase|nr:N-acetylmuramoyl-L-alanine amidase [Treponema sp.]